MSVEFELYGLTERQKVLADMLWACPEWTDIERLLKALPKRERKECESIIEMMKMAVVEQCYAGIKQEYNEARQLINKVKGKR